MHKLFPKKEACTELRRWAQKQLLRTQGKALSVSYTWCINLDTKWRNIISKGRTDCLKCGFYLYKIDGFSGKLLITEVMYSLCSALTVRLVYTPNKMLSVDRNFWLELYDNELFRFMGGREGERRGGRQRGKEKGGKRLKFHSLQKGTQRYPACFSVERFNPPFHHNALH